MEDKEKLKQISDILNECTTLPCAENGCDCDNCEDETALDGGVNTCMQYGINKILGILED